MQHGEPTGLTDKADRELTFGNSICKFSKIVLHGFI